MPTLKYENEFTVRDVGETTGTSYAGKFKVKTRLSHRDRLNIDNLRRQLLGPVPEGNMPSERAINTAEIFSQLGFRIIEAPSWWTSADNGLGLDDDNIVGKVYNAALKAESDEIKKVQGDGEQAKTDLEQDAKATPAE
jgi:hypothetical protein